MSLSVPSGAISCGAGSCDVGTGFPFTLAVDVVAGPAAGYALMQTYIDYGDYDPTASEDGAGANTCSDGFDNGGADGNDRYDADCATTNLTYKPAPDVTDEIVWPDLDDQSAVQNEDGVGLLGFGGLSSLAPPLPKSNHVGSVVEVTMTCVTGGEQTVVSLLPEGDPVAMSKGAEFVEPDGVTHVVPKVGSLTINCVTVATPTSTPTPTLTPTVTNTPTPTATPEKLPDPGDTDGDGCSDQRENGADETLGGQRDYVNPYDFYNLPGLLGEDPDDVIDLSNDILGVINHYAPMGTEPAYDVVFDRGPTAGPNPWNMTAPDGVIDLSNDILGVIFQYLHDCR